MKMSTFFKTVVALFLLTVIPCLSATADSKGVKLMKENFDYTAGTDLIKNGNWKNFQYFIFGMYDSNPVKVVEGGLTYPDYQGTATGNSVELTEAGNDASIRFVPQDGAIYASMLVNVKAAPTEKGDFFFSFGDLTNSTTEGYGKLHIKNIDGKLAFSVTRRNTPETEGTVFTNADYNFNTTYLIVVKYTQDETDGQVELFINPNPNAAEPASLLTSKDGKNPKQLKFINLYQGRKLGSDVLVDAIRVATSWEALFDNSEVTKLPFMEAPASKYMGTYKEGSEQPLTSSITVIAENLEGDITVSTQSGIVTPKTTTITKADAESDKGYTLEFSVKPENSTIKNDKLIVTSGTVSCSTEISWSYFIPTPNLEASDIATVLAATKEVIYTLVNPVKVTNVENMGYAIKYTIEDQSGSLSFFGNFMSLGFQVGYGATLTNLALKIQSDPESQTFIPSFFLNDECPDLTVEPMKQNGVKTFSEVFAYEAGDLKNSGTWKAYNYYNKEGDPVKLEAGGLSDYIYQPMAEGNSVVLHATGESATATFQGVGGTIYTSFLTNVRAASEEGNMIYSFGYEGQNTFGEGYGIVLVKKVGDKVVFGISQNGSDEDVVKYGEEEYDMNQPHLIVIKYYQGPGNGDDYAVLFVDPNILGPEPENLLKTSEVRGEPYPVLNGINLYQYTNTGLGTTYDVLIDAIRVATSWESLFNRNGVETAPEVMVMSSDGVKTRSFNLGNMKQGDEPMVTTIKIQGKDLKSDLTLNSQPEDYFQLSATTVSQEDAQSENGFNLQITLNPKNGAIKKGSINITGELINVELSINWDYSTIGNVNTIEELKAVEYTGFYTLVNQVNVEDLRIEKDNYGNETTYYTLTDNSGSIEVQRTKQGPRAVSKIENIKKGDNIRKVCIGANNNNNAETFTFVMSDSPELEIIPSGIENIDGGTITGYADGKFIAEGATSIKLFDVNGKSLKEVNGETLNMSELPAAMYIVQFAGETGKVYTVKVMK